MVSRKCVSGLPTNPIAQGGTIQFVMDSKPGVNINSICMYSNQHLVVFNKKRGALH